MSGSFKQELLEKVRTKIADAERLSGRSAGSVCLVAVSKTKPWEDVADFARLGVKVFGENYVQEALAKIEALRSASLPVQPEWHFIGTLQSNKAKFIPGNFSLFHGLDSLSLAQKLNAAAEKTKIILSCLVEVNVDEEISKGGAKSEGLLRLLEGLSGLESLHIKGLMCIPKANGSTRPAFARLRNLLEHANDSSAYKLPLSELSMGMSADYADAILEGATIVRVGTALFGARS